MRHVVVVLCLVACGPDIEKVPKGGPPITVDDYIFALRATIEAQGRGRIQRYSDVEGGIVISANSGLCDTIKLTVRDQMPDGSFVTCREDGRIKWELDRR
ncbi:MAG: hypothetical protein HOV81_33010 [Kofleriaceae bacterium]|nr:hypothetical protein [Kofleriaceae bacterium]